MFRRMNGVWVGVLLGGFALPVGVGAQDGDLVAEDSSAVDASAVDASAADASEASGGYLWELEQFDLSEAILKPEISEWLDFGGWVQAGYTSKSTGLFNNMRDRFNVHQAWFYAEKAVDGSKGFDFGGRVDFMYGTDAGDTQSFGNNPGNFDFQSGWDTGSDYGYAMPQLYGEVAWGDLSVKAGHFYTLLGYEVVTAPDNFFFSHAFTMYNSEAFTHTGALATYAVPTGEEMPGVTLYGGWTLGWDTGFDQFNGGNSFLGGATIEPMEGISITYITTVGDLGWNGTGYTHSLVATVKITDELTYVAQNDVARFNGDREAGTGPDRDTIGLNQYLIYAINDAVGVGARGEWWKADGVSYYSATIGVNVKPQANLTIRPELRYQWSPSAGFNPEVPEDEGVIFGVDAILTY